MTDLKNPSLPEKWTHTPVPGNEEHERLHPPKDDWEQIERYRDQYIGKHTTGTITVRKQGDPFYGEFIIALDDSKMHGNRREIPGANNIEWARNSIDLSYISGKYPDHWKGETDDERIASQKKAFCRFLKDTIAEYKERPAAENRQYLISAVRLLHEYHDHRGKLFVPRAELDDLLREHGFPSSEKILQTQQLTAAKQQEAPPKQQKPKYEVFVDPKTDKVYGDSHFKIGLLKENIPAADYEKMLAGHIRHDFAKASDAKAFVAEQQEKAAAKGHTPPDPNRPLTEKQIEAIEKFGTPEAKAALKAGDNAAARKHLDAQLKEWEEKKNAPLTDKQRELVTRYGGEQAREAIAKGDNAAARSALNGILKEWEEKKRTPLTGKQQIVVEKYGSPELKKAVENGDYQAARLFIREKAKEIDRRPLTEKQMNFLNRIADRPTLEKVQGGDHHAGRKFLSDFNRSVTVEVAKWQEKNPEFKTPEATAELKKAEFILRVNGLESHREVAYGQVAKEGRDVKELVSHLREKVATAGKEKTPSGPEK